MESVNIQMEEKLQEIRPRLQEAKEPDQVKQEVPLLQSKVASVKPRRFPKLAAIGDMDKILKSIVGVCFILSLLYSFVVLATRLINSNSTSLTPDAPSIKDIVSMLNTLNADVGGLSSALGHSNIPPLKSWNSTN